MAGLLRNPRVCAAAVVRGAPPESTPFCGRDTTLARQAREFRGCKADRGAETSKIGECLVAEHRWIRDTADLFLAPYKEQMRRDSASRNPDQQFQACRGGTYAAVLRDCLIAEFGWTSDSAERYLDRYRPQMSRDSAERALLATVPPGMMPCVAAYDSTILVFAEGADSGTAPLSRLGGRRTCMGLPNDMAVDRGELYVLGQMGEGQSARTAVAVFARGDSAEASPRRRILVPLSSGNPAPGIALDRDGRLYVTTGDYPPALVDVGAGKRVPGAVQVYAPGADGVATPIRTLAGQATLLQQPTDVAFDSRGLMYVANFPGWITAYDGTAEGNAMPYAMIKGPHAGLGRVAKLAVGPGDTLFVLSGQWLSRMGFTGSGTVTVYPPGATGDVAPVRTLYVNGGPKAKAEFRTLTGAQGLAVDGRGALYVATSGAVAVYAPGAEGDAVPLRIVRGPRGDYDWGRSVTLDDDGRLYVSREPVIAGW